MAMGLFSILWGAERWVREWIKNRSITIFPWMKNERTYDVCVSSCRSIHVRASLRWLKSVEAAKKTTSCQAVYGTTYQFLHERNRNFGVLEGNHPIESFWNPDLQCLQLASTTRFEARLSDSVDSGNDCTRSLWTQPWLNEHGKWILCRDRCVCLNFGFWIPIFMYENARRKEEENAIFAYRSPFQKCLKDHRYVPYFNPSSITKPKREET